MFPRPVVHLDFSDGNPDIAGDGRNKPVQFSVEIDVFDDLSAEGLESTPKIMEFDVGDSGRLRDILSGA